MEDWEQKNLIAELTMGRETARQLQFHLHMPSSSRETREVLVQRILASYEKALAIVNFGGPAGDPHPTGVAIPMSESSPSLSTSPRSEDSADRDFKEQDTNNDGSRKRKSMPRWTRQVQVSPGMGLEGPLDDGFSWRKYGQKDILGAKYPRGYYRCTHRNVRGCLATKQVQRSDEDPTIFEITYRGRHTCNQATHMLPPSQSLENFQEPVINSKSILIEPQQHTIVQPTENNNQQQLLLNFRNGLKVITQDLDSHGGEPSTIFPCFHFPASTSSAIPAGNHRGLFSPSMADSTFNMGSFSPPLVSPSTTSGTASYLSVPPSSMNNRFGGNQNFKISELDDIVSAVTSTTSSPAVGLNFPFDNIEFDANFTFDSPRHLN